jgi:hypothetical protein
MQTAHLLFMQTTPDPSRPAGRGEQFTALSEVRDLLSFPRG